MRKLNLASGTDLRDPPWENWDIVRRWPTNKRDADRVWDARSNRIDCPDGSVDEIVAGYLFLHVPYEHHAPLAAEMFRVLCPKGRLEVGEVDMPLAMRRWLVNPEDKSAREMIWGENAAVHGEEFAMFDRHIAGHSETTLRLLLMKAGFVGLQRVKMHSADVWYELTLRAVKP